MTGTEETPARGLGRLAAAWRSGPLSVPGFRLLTFGQFASTIGDYCYAVALPWLALSGGGSAASLGVVLACYGIPRALLTVPGGSLADRFGPRLMMLSSDFARCALTAVFAALAAAHVSSLAALAPVAALLGAFSALFLPASMTMMPSLIEPAGLTAANAVYTGFVQAGSMLGPVIGGVLVASTGPTTAFGVDAGSYLVSAVTLAFIPASARATAAGEPAAVDDTAPEETAAQAGPPAPATPAPRSVWVLLRQARILQIILVVSLAANFALIGTTEVALPALAHARFGADGYGAVLTCVAVAALAGALIVGKFGDRFRPVTLIAGSVLAGAAGIAAAPFLGGLPGLAAGLVVLGLSLGFDNVLSVTVIQRWAPPALLGRVWGLLLLCGAGSFPVSSFIAGQLTRHLGPAPVFPIAGALLAVAMAYGLTQREFRDFGTGDGAGDKEKLSADKGLSQAGA
jgi:MFS family permease